MVLWNEYLDQSILNQIKFIVIKKSLFSLKGIFYFHTILINRNSFDLKKDNFLVNRLKGVGYAFKGAFMLLKYEASIQVQAFIAIAVTIAGFYFEISTTEWLIQILTIAVVMGIEGANTAIEEIADFIHPEHHSKIGYIKDMLQV